ncbi:MAG TPA: membrane dipeptidase [Ktedonobacterales bacterium]|nr:membrane dipeptidase [Ktedonobacterales bacterium]
MQDEEAIVFIVDAHEDIAYNALHHDRDIRQPLAAIREGQTARARARAAASDPAAHMDETAMVALDAHRRGGVGLIFATIFVPPGDQETMTQDGLAQLAWYEEAAHEDPGIRLIRTRDELAGLRRDWEAAATPESRPVGLLLLMEGADPLPTPAALQAYYDRGLRIVGTSWQGTRYGGGTHAPGPLTALGGELLDEMARLGMILDVSHMAAETFWQALDRFPGTVFASHSNCRAYTPTDRHLSDEMIQALAARDAVIGTVLANSFLDGDWKHGDALPTLDAVVRHIDHIRELTGTTAHSAIGSDLDGGFGVESTPAELDSVGDLPRIADALAAHGYARAEIEGIMGGNWLRLLERALPA